MGCTPHFLRSSSQCHTLVINNNSQEKKEQSRGDSKERRDVAQRFTSPMLFSGPQKPPKKSTNPARLTYGKPTGKSGAEKAGRALSETGLSNGGDTWG